MQPEIRSFVSVLRSPVTPFDRSKTKNANCFEERNVFGNGKCDLSALRVRSDCDQDRRPCDQAAMRIYDRRAHTAVTSQHGRRFVLVFREFDDGSPSFQRVPESFSHAGLFLNLPFFGFVGLEPSGT